MENFNISTNTRISAKVAKVLHSQVFFFWFPQFYDNWKIGENFPQKIAKLVENLHLEKQKNPKDFHSQFFLFRKRTKNLHPTLQILYKTRKKYLLGHCYKYQKRIHHEVDFFGFFLGSVTLPNPKKLIFEYSSKEFALFLFSFMDLESAHSAQLSSAQRNEAK